MCRRVRDLDSCLTQSKASAEVHEQSCGHIQSTTVHVEREKKLSKERTRRMNINMYMYLHTSAVVCTVTMSVLTCFMPPPSAIQSAVEAVSARLTEKTQELNLAQLENDRLTVSTAMS